MATSNKSKAGDEMIGMSSNLSDEGWEAEASMYEGEEDDEYWSRLNSAAFDEEYDNYDALADAVEAKYEQQQFRSLRRANPRPVAWRERKGRSEFAEGGSSIAEPPASHQAVAAAPASAAQLRSAPLVPPVDFDPRRVIDAVIAVSKAMSAATQVKSSSSRRHLLKLDVPQQVLEQAAPALISGYEHMLASLRQLRSRYHGSASDDAIPFPVGGDVPSYFANVGGDSIYARKLFSIAGLRNLVLSGPLIFRHLADKLFSGSPSAYGPNEGLSLMRRVTGNVVDLDTTVLRCTSVATLQAINLSQAKRGHATFSSVSEFGASSTAAEIARNCAVLALEDFSTQFALTAAQQRSRLVHPDQIPSTIPLATNNLDRGHTPLWHYVNAGQDSFHANVPTVDDVVGALLLAPFHCVQHYASLHVTATGDASRLRLENYAEFFDQCIVDSCFNGKWKAIEEYGAVLAARGTIRNVLDELQQKHQDRFTAEIFDLDEADGTRDRETSLMWSLAQGLVGRDAMAGGTLRSITRKDVDLWIAQSQTA